MVKLLKFRQRHLGRPAEYPVVGQCVVIVGESGKPVGCGIVIGDREGAAYVVNGYLFMLYDLRQDRRKKERRRR